LPDRRVYTEWYRGFQEYILAAPQFAPLRELFPENAEQFADFAVARHSHSNAVQYIRHFLDAAWQPLLLRAIEGFVRERLKLAMPEPSEDDLTLSERLSYRGYVTLPPLDASAVAEMKGYFEAQQVLAERGEDDRYLAPLAEARVGNIAHYPPATNLACPQMVAQASDPAVLAVVGNYLGAPPMILNYAAWWSFAGVASASGPQLFHRDADDYRFCKLFIYLTDVDENCGPHMYMEGTHELEKIPRVRMNAPPKGNRMSDEEVIAEHRQRPVTLTGKAGTRFLVDTGGIHKGKLPETADRLIAQVLYGVSPNLPYEYLNAGWEERSRNGLLGVKPAGESALYDYANRLFLRA
jgi:hypothetical protein